MQKQFKVEHPRKKPFMINQPKQNKRLLRKPEVEAMFGISRSTFRDRVINGLMIPPVNIFGRVVGFPSSEIEMLYLMYVAEAPEEEIKFLVQQLMKARTQAVMNIV